MKRSANHSPNDYTITDSIREWASERYGLPHLPDVFIQDWQDAAAARGSTYADCERALQNWIRWSGPSGRFYNSADWERKLKAAKKMHGGVRLSKPPATVAGRYVDENGQPIPEPALPSVTPKAAARVALATLMAKLA